MSEIVTYDTPQTPSYLTQEEQSILDQWTGNGLLTGDKLKAFAAFLDNMSCLEITEMYPELSMGALLKTRIQDEWDVKRNEFLEQLYLQAMNNAKKAHLDGVNFVSSITGIFHKKYAPMIKKYYVTGDPEDLGELKDLKFRDYKTTMELLIKMVALERSGPGAGVKVEINSTTNNLTQNNQLTSEHIESLFKKLAAPDGQ